MHYDGILIILTIILYYTGDFVMDKMFYALGHLWNDLMSSIGAYGLKSDDIYGTGVFLFLLIIISVIAIGGRDR